MFTLAASWLVVTLAILFVIVCLFMMLVILIQKPKGGGLSGAFGGAGGGANDAFGAKTGDVLTWFTVGCFVAFLALAMGLTWTIAPTSIEEVFGTVDTTEQAPASQTLPQEDAQLPAEAGMVGGEVEDEQVNTRVGDEVGQRVDTAVEATRQNTQEVDEYLENPQPGENQTQPLVPSLIEDENAPAQ